MDFLKSLMPDGLRGAIAAKATRWVATFVAGMVLKWLFTLLAHYGLPTDGQLGDIAKEIAGAVFTILAGGGALAYSVLDAKNVDTKMKVTASVSYDMGAAAAPMADPQVAKVAAVQAAIKTADKAAPETQAAIVNSLNNGTF